MSIISDALRKARPERVVKEKRVHAPIEGPHHKGTHWSFLTGMAVVLFVLVPFLAASAVKVTRSLSTGSGALTIAFANANQVVEADAEVGESQFLVEERPFVRSEKGPIFKLEGIVFGKDAQYAILNGDVITPGDVIQGAKLVTIAQDRVELDYEGRKIILRSENVN